MLSDIVFGFKRVPFDIHEQIFINASVWTNVLRVNESNEYLIPLVQAYLGVRRRNGQAAVTGVVGEACFQPVRG